MCSLYLGDQIISGQTTLVGESRNIGQIIPSVIPLTDAGLHLLDGALIQGSGIYSAFVDYIAGLDLTANYFCTEQEWQASVTQYGVCGKFVYDSTNNTVRLPKITGIIEGTTDVSALGDLVEAGLPNLSLYTPNSSNKYGAQANVVYNVGSTSGGGNSIITINQNPKLYVKDDNNIVGNSSTVQPQTIKAFYYIVIATSTKTDIQVDIDEIATDLNGKVNTADLAEVQCVVETYRNGTSWYRVYSDGWCEQGGKTDVLGSNVNTTITLLKQFGHTNYNVTACERYDSGTSDNNNENYWVSSVSGNSFAIYNSAGGYKQIYWQACGYIEV